jgi:hypothetical protein
LSYSAAKEWWAKAGTADNPSTAAKTQSKLIFM